MAESRVRGIAAQAVVDVLRGRSLSEVLAARQQQVSERDRPLLAELTYGVCRWYYRLDAILGKLLDKPLKPRDLDVKALLLVGLQQLLFTRIPAHAAIGETAGAARRLNKRWAVALVNGCLRRFQREQQSLLDAIADDPQARFSQPHWIVEALRQAWPSRFEAIGQGLLLRPPFSLRVNLQRGTRQEYLSALSAAGLSVRPVEGIRSALLLERPVPVTGLPGFAEGRVSVQDAGAQLAAELLDVAPGMQVLDACAAPGGKTGHLLEKAADLRLTAVDLEGQRLQRVAENLQRLGYTAELVAGDAARPTGPWASRCYDRILVDAPCTATGVMRRNPDIKLLRRASDVAALVERQRQILEAQWRLLKSGGKLLYATCSLLPRENEEQIAAFVRRHKEASAVALASEHGISTEHGLQLLPDNQETDGFYYALLEKRNE